MAQKKGDEMDPHREVRNLSIIGTSLGIFLTLSLFLSAGSFQRWPIS